MKKFLTTIALLMVAHLSAFSYSYTKRHVLIPMRDGVRLYTEFTSR